MSMTCQPTFRINSDASQRRQSSVSVCCLGPEIARLLVSRPRSCDFLKSIFQLTVEQVHSCEGEGTPNVSGRYLVLEDEVRFVPHFPFESNLKYRVSFDPRPLGLALTAEPFNWEFLIPAEQDAPPATDVTHIYPSCDLLPENLLRFYVCFSNAMLRGRALKEISLLDSDGLPVTDALYRPPLELWDPSTRYLTVLLDPGRLKRWVGPNVELGPPLKAGQKYTLEIGSGMTDLHGRPLRVDFRKSFIAGDPIREAISVESWKIFPPAMGSRHAVVLMFTTSLDWALLPREITVESAEGLMIDGSVVVDQCERRWSFTPALPWTAGMYYIRVGNNLEDVCGNGITGAFDRPIRAVPDQLTGTSNSPLKFSIGATAHCSVTGARLASP
jgi:hypothetical protein